MTAFSARITKLGINPCVDVPQRVIDELSRDRGPITGPITVRGTLKGAAFRQTVVKFRGAWRLYINTEMRRAARAAAGDVVDITLEYDPEPRVVPMHPALARALAGNEKAKAVFERLPPSHQKEYLNYLNSLKTAETTARVIDKIIRRLSGHAARRKRRRNRDA